MAVGKTTKSKKVAQRSLKTGRVAAMKGSKRNFQEGPTKRQKFSVTGQASYNR